MTPDELRHAWEMEGQVAQDVVSRARVEVQYALHLAGVAAVQAGAGDESFEWNLGSRQLVSPGLGDGSVRVAVEPAGLALVVTDGSGAEKARLALGGQTLAGAATWLGDQLRTNGLDSGALETTGQPEGLPTHPLADGGAFGGGADDALAEVARWYANASRALVCVAEATGASVEPRINASGAAMTCAVTTNGGARIEIGFDPGRVADEEPTFFTRSGTAPTVSADALPELEGGGEWNTDGWFGTRLVRSEWTFYDAEQLQADCAVAFLESSIEETGELLGS